MRDVRFLVSEHLIHSSLSRKWNAPSHRKKKLRKWNQTITFGLNLCYRSLIFTSFLFSTANDQQFIDFRQLFVFWGLRDFFRVVFCVFVTEEWGEEGGHALYRKVVRLLKSEHFFSKFPRGWHNGHLFVTLAFLLASDARILDSEGVFK
jgi:hypothetical protein